MKAIVSAAALLATTASAAATCKSGFQVATGRSRGQIKCRKMSDGRQTIVSPTASCAADACAKSDDSTCCDVPMQKSATSSNTAGAEEKKGTAGANEAAAVGATAVGATENADADSQEAQLAAALAAAETLLAGAGMPTKPSECAAFVKLASSEPEGLENSNSGFVKPSDADQKETLAACIKCAGKDLNCWLGETAAGSILPEAPTMPDTAAECDGLVATILRTEQKEAAKTLCDKCAGKPGSCMEENAGRGGAGLFKPPPVKPFCEGTIKCLASCKTEFTLNAKTAAKVGEIAGKTQDAAKCHKPPESNGMDCSQQDESFVSNACDPFAKVMETKKTGQALIDEKKTAKDSQCANLPTKIKTLCDSCIDDPAQAKCTLKPPEEKDEERATEVVGCLDAAAGDTAELITAARKLCETNALAQAKMEAKRAGVPDAIIAEEAKRIENEFKDLNRVGLAKQDPCGLLKNSAKTKCKKCK